VDLTHVKVHAQAFTKGIRGGARIREHLPRVASAAEAATLFRAHLPRSGATGSAAPTPA
jgi:hypothetical protein